MPFGRETRIPPNQPAQHGRSSGATLRNRWNDAETTAFQHGRKKKRCRTPAVDLRCRADGPSMDGRRTARWPWPQTCRRCDIRSNQIKASLSAFQRGKVKVLGFGVKARLRPQRMALRWDYDPFAPVGANGKACGEASRVSSSGTPPFLWGCLPMVLGTVLTTRRLDIRCHVRYIISINQTKEVRNARGTGRQRIRQGW